jgi:hypothetical protein
MAQKCHLSLAGQEHRLRVLQNFILKILRRRWEEVTGGYENCIIINFKIRILQYVKYY